MKESLRLERDIMKIRNDVEVIKGKDEWIMINISKKTWARIPQKVGELLTNSENKTFDEIMDEPYDRNQASGFLFDLMELGLIEKLHKGYEKIYLCVTERCNLKCETCYRSLSHEKDIKTPDLISLISKIAFLNPKELAVTGGEPTLRDDLVIILKAAKLLGCNITLLTNGTHITSDLAEYLAKEKIKIQISVDSPNGAENDSIRGEGSLQKTVAGIELLRDKGVENVEVTMTLVDSVGTGLYEAQRYWHEKQIGFHSSIFINMHPQTCNLCMKDHRKLGQNFLLYLESKLNDVTAREFIKLCEIMELVPGAGCMAGEKILAISQWGKVYPCHLLMYEEMAIDIDLFIAGKANNVMAVPGIKEIKECSLCDMRYFCKGGCRAAAYAAYGDMREKDPRCDAYKMFLETFLWSWNDHRNFKDNLSQVRKMLH